MNFDFSDDQKLLADQVKRYLDDNCGMDRVRQVVNGFTPYGTRRLGGPGEDGAFGYGCP